MKIIIFTILFIINGFSQSNDKHLLVDKIINDYNLKQKYDFLTSNEDSYKNKFITRLDTAIVNKIIEKVNLCFSYDSIKSSFAEKLYGKYSLEELKEINVAQVNGLVDSRITEFQFILRDIYLSKAEIFMGEAKNEILAYEKIKISKLGSNYDFILGKWEIVDMFTTEDGIDLNNYSLPTDSYNVYFYFKPDNNCNMIFPDGVNELGLYSITNSTLSIYELEGFKWKNREIVKYYDDLLFLNDDSVFIVLKKIKTK